jgi:hypothetical protein
MLRTALAAVSRRQASLAAFAVLALALAACGSSSPGGSSAATGGARSTASGPAGATAGSSSSAASGGQPALDELGPAQRPGPSEFPATDGRSLEQLAQLSRSTLQLGAATGSFTPGTRRYAFALYTPSGRIVYAPTAVYIASNPKAPAIGPVLAPADLMTVARQFRSEQNSGPGGIEAIYHAELHLPAARTYALLVLTRTPSGLDGATGEVAVAASSPIPNVGQRAPDIATDTLATVHGDVKLLTTRLPPEQMASVSLNQVLGKRPVALLFSTPQLCTSRVCGPVTDIAVELQHEFSGRIAFIHEEVYVDNQPSKGLRPQLKAFHLQTEPWLFAINRKGVIVARLEGAFGVSELRAALEAALR